MKDTDAGHNKCFLSSPIPKPGGASLQTLWVFETAFLNRLDTPCHLFPPKTSKKAAPSPDSLGLSSSDS